ncbi:MAG TPA: DUF4440 domain-containing protein [Bacteroidales bacterium]|nr:DUF4440 domain-containing protein [Bacteroidales bacterium]HRZ50064.1 DUF4440 domain-containing protein [Bacteroidales bacterium]
MKQFLLALALVSIFVSCNQKTNVNDEGATSPVDSLIALYEKAWNSNDSAAICSMFAPDAIVVDGELVMLNAAEMAEKWVSPYHRYARNLKTEKLKEWATPDRAGYSGMYALDIVVNDSLRYSPYGIFTMVWEKTPDGFWKVSTANMNPLPRPDSK